MKIAWVSILVVMLGITTGCSSGPPPIKPGSPAFFWAVARESYRTGDLAKTDATLIDLSQTDSVFAAPARTWQLIVAAGMTNGYMELANAYQAAGQANPANAKLYRREMANLRSLAATTALEFAQSVHTLATTDQNARVLLAFPFPPGSAVKPEALAQLVGGALLADAERDALLTAMLERGAVLSVSAAVGSPEDPGRAQAAYLAPEVRVARETFLYGMAKLLYQESDLFGPDAMDREDRFILMCRTASDVLTTIPQTAEVAALAAEIRSTLSQYGGI